MQPVKFPESNFTWGVPPGHEDRIQPLPCWVERAPGGQIITTLSIWELTDEEVEYIVQNRKMAIKQANGGQPLQPILPIAGPIEFPRPFAFCSVFYQSQSSLKGVWVWVSENIHVPELISLEGELYAFSDKYKPRLEVGKALDLDALYFRTATPAEAKERLEYNLQQLETFTLNGALTKEAMAEELKIQAVSTPVLCRKLQAGKDEILM